MNEYRVTTTITIMADSEAAAMLAISEALSAKPILVDWEFGECELETDEEEL